VKKETRKSKERMKVKPCDSTHLNTESCEGGEEGKKKEEEKRKIDCKPTRHVALPDLCFVTSPVVFFVFFHRFY